MLTLAKVKRLVRYSSTGPWELGKDRGKARRYINAPGWEELAKVVTRMEGDTDEHAEGLANAELIAAAPEIAEFAIEQAEANERLRELLKQAHTLLNSRVHPSDNFRLYAAIEKELAE